MKKGIILLLFLGGILASEVRGQPYEFGVGIRAGYTNGINVNYFFERDRALGLLAAYNAHGFQSTFKYVYEFTPYDKRRLYYYFGGGIQLGNWDNAFAGGVAIVAGAEFVMREIPLVIGAEWKPMVNAIEVFGYELIDFGVIVRYVFD